MAELIYHPAGQSFGHYLKLDSQPTGLSQLTKPMGSGLSGPRFSRVPSILTKFCQGNFERILQSIAVAKSRGATLRVGPELEIP